MILYIVYHKSTDLSAMIEHTMVHNKNQQNTNEGNTKLDSEFLFRIFQIYILTATILLHFKICISLYRILFALN